MLGDVGRNDEFAVDEHGRLNVFGQDEVSDGAPAGSPWDDEVDAGWDPSDHVDAWEDCGDGSEAWLGSLPPGLRAEVEARPPVTVLPWEAGPAAARESFADGGLGDAMLPGWLLGQLLAEATVEGYRELADDELAGVLRAWQRQVAHDQASLAAAVGCLADRRAAGSSRAAEHVADELAAELTLTGRAAGRQLELAAGLGRLPAVVSAVLSGLIDWPRACVFAGELAVLDDAAAAEVAEALADRAAGWTSGQLRAALARAVLAADPGAAARRRQTARKDSRVELWREGSGNSALAGRELAPADVIAADARLRADADWARAHGADGTVAELRAAAFIARLTGRGLDALLPAGCGAAPAEPPAGSIHLTMPVSAYLGGGEPGEVAGYGPIDAGTSRELAGLLDRDPATRWCLTLTSPGGAAVAHGCARRGPAPGEPVIAWAAGLRERMLVLQSGACTHARQAAGYVPPPRLRHLVTVRQRRCAFPGCRQPARRCDLDHTIPYHHGGRTCECNLAPLCRRHHKAKQAPGWHLTQDQPGHMTWRLPSGRVYDTAGDPY